MTLALLLTAVTGAWAGETPLLTIESKDNTDFHIGSKTFDDKVTVTVSSPVDNDGDEWGWYAGNPSLLTVAGINGYTITSCKFYTQAGTAANGYTVQGESPSVYLSGAYVYTDDSKSETIGNPGITKIEVFGTASASSGPMVAWNASTKTGTFSMPGSDVVLTPQYAPTAKWAVVDNVEQLPAALEGIIAGQDAAIVTAGQSAQGTVMYAVTTTAEAAPALTAFSATVPTAKDIADDGATLYVWYYIQGADAPEGVAATLDNTFDNTEPACLTVTVLSNKFDLTFNAANANTIEAGKATVTVDGTDKTGDIAEGKLQGVKMGREVKVKANTGYKFRKVEVKKKEEAPATPLDNTTTAWTAGTFAVPAGGLTYSDAITVSGNVTLTLTDGETLTLNKGISLASGATLTIQGNGAMVVNGTSGSTASTVAGSTGTLILTSGTLTATGGKGQDMTDSEKTGASGGAAINGSVTVNGGSLTANGGNGGNCIGYAMNVTNGGAGGAAISGDVTITDGAVAATGGNGGNIQDDRGGYSVHGGAGGAAIGGNATLTGGTLTTKQGANGTETGSNIRSSVGTGGKAVAGTVTNNGGTVNQ